MNILIVTTSKNRELIGRLCDHLHISKRTRTGPDHSIIVVEQGVRRIVGIRFLIAVVDINALRGLDNEREWISKLEMFSRIVVYTDHLEASVT